MRNWTDSSSNGPSLARVWVVVLGLALFPADLIPAGRGAPRAAPAFTSQAAPCLGVSCPRIAAPSPSTGRHFAVDSSNPIYWVFNNKTRMVQVATVGMAIGLFIMMRK